RRGRRDRIRGRRRGPPAVARPERPNANRDAAPGRRRDRRGGDLLDGTGIGDREGDRDRDRDRGRATSRPIPFAVPFAISAPGSPRVAAPRAVRLAERREIDVDDSPSFAAVEEERAALAFV